MIDISHAKTSRETPTHVVFVFAKKDIGIPKKYLKRVGDSYYVDEDWIDRMLLNHETAPAFDQGVVAWRDGLSRNSNNHTAGSLQSEEWFDGWDNGASWEQYLAMKDDDA